tara:strand:+ start:1522 stop:1932 length:411 start_codon:yes stop_codon:yes gene_type:complete
MNKIFEEYILQNKPQHPPRDVSLIEMVADEVNKTLNNLPEIQLASEVLSEEELKDLFSPFAKQVVMKVSNQIEEEIRKLVEVTITAQQAAKMLAGVALEPSEKAEIVAQINAEDASLVGINAQELENVTEQEDNND